MRNVLEYLEESASRLPQKTAVRDSAAEYSFIELLDKSRRIGSALSARDVVRRPVAVMMDKGAAALSAFFGIAYAGGFYVLMNPDLPKSRLMQIREVLGSDYVITDEAHKEAAEAVFGSAAVLDVADLAKTEHNEKALLEIRERMIDTDPLYANFTSGSTGVPKGVVVSHRSVIDFINVFTELFSIGEDDIIANQAPFDFDVSVKDIYSAMKVGATLVVVEKQLFSRPTELIDCLCENNVTTMIWAVSALCLISTFHGLDYKVPKTVNKVLFSGEVMPAKHLKEWMSHLPEATFVNLYGPTEITCNCTYHIINPSSEYKEGIPIGKPFPNEQILLLCGDRLAEAGEEGEICVRGTALALGYYNAPEQTAKAFTPDPTNPYYPELIYHTGDLGRYGEDGELYFCGRKDFQIKHMGHRIELEEVELAISAVPGVERCVCFFDEQRQKLYGFYIGSIEKRELHMKLRESLPIFMVPGALRKVEEFPLTKNGKTDRKKLFEEK
ncbi:MAG: amino acid adenylation domain-containing protein [Clostridia bacterium]|nr:amino acid adenylation domain-containing protein [Clostridia bacterium]